ncbi:fam-a protein [Plasmodium chabaudi adami]|uniref:Fam-a protein n=1 Tax=Plasmodium chabaudi adami TaxID=5826 RepID=A0A1C6WNR4_PLACE|nr:fam-a protein [Plasmodium chabaudi adami]
MNKVYIKIALALLSLVGYMENVAFASEAATNSVKKSPTLLQNEFEQHIDLICDDVNEAILAVENVNSTSELLIKLSETSVDGYSTYYTENENEIIYSKKIGNMDIGRLHVTIPSVSKYLDILRNLWDVNNPQKTDDKIINGNIVRLYCKFLVMFEKQNIDGENLRSKKRYALGARFKQSNDKTVIVCPSRNIYYEGTIQQETDLKEIFENTKSIENDIDAEEALVKLGDNIAGFIIKKGDDDQVHIIYINAIYEGENYTSDKKERDATYKNILSLAQRI